MEKSCYMVEVNRARKRYGQHVVLNGLNMTVPKGVIYGLLGPSGCGKTTLLSCIVGHRHLDSGTITLAVNKRKHIGFMPQEIALFLEFRIDEIFFYYGRLFGIRPSIVHDRLRELSKLLELPMKSRVISSLSGGQQRRVSLAASLLHSPSLLILDEPTVGLDPLLCHSVWQFMLKITQEQAITIIITTHYIEEARHSHVIGLMREGVLLVEEQPETLIADQNSSSLEEVFLHLSKKQQAYGSFAIDYDNNNTVNIKQANILPEGTLKYYRFQAQLERNIKWTYRNWPMLIFMLMLPVIQSLLYCSSFGTAPSKLPVAIVSEEFPNLNVCDQISFNVTYSEALGCDVPISLPCQYVQRLSQRTSIMAFEDVVQAKLAAERNEVWGVIFINRNFSNAFLERIGNGFSTDDISLDQSVLSVWMDMTDYIIATYLRNHILESLTEFVEDVLTVCGINPEVGKIPIKLNDAIYGKEDDSGFRFSGVPGFLCSFIFYMPVTFTSGALMMDKRSGFIDRIMIAGLTNLEMVLAHVVVQIVLSTVQTAIMMLICYVAYPQEIYGEIPTIALIIYSVMILGIVYGFLLAAALPDDNAITYAGIGTILTIFLISGMIWPSEGAHVALKSWSKGFPVVAAIHSYSAVTIKGFTLSDPIVYIGLSITWAWIFLMSLATVLFYKFYSK